MKGIHSARGGDSHSFKTVLPMYLPPDDRRKADFVIPDTSNKAAWGWNNNVTACFLCPMRLVSKFDKDPQ